MHTTSRLAKVWLALVLAYLTTQAAEAQFAPLIKHVPSSANTIFLLNAEKVFNSEVALREGWRQNFEKAIASGMVRLPEDTLQYVLAGQVNFEFVHPDWQVGLLRTKDKHDMAFIASEKDGTQDTVAGQPAVLLPSTVYVVQFDPYTYGTLVPASRQAVARWVTETKAGDPKFSDYIQEAIGYSEKAGTEIILALDLSNAFDSKRIKEYLASSPVIADKKVDVDAAAEALGSLRGIMLGVTLGEKPFGSIKVDFGKDASVLKNVAGPLLVEILSNRGAMIDDFQTWKGDVKEDQVVFTGFLTTTGLRQILSLMDAPVSNSLPSESDTGQQSASDTDPKVVASQKYFASVEQFMTDLKDKEPQRIAQYGIWFDKYANKIDQLPMVNVDDTVLDYGAYVSQQFRNAAAAVQGIGMRSRVRQVQNVNAAGGPGWYGANYDGGYYYGGSYYHGYNGFARNNALQAGLREQQRVRTQVKTEEKVAGVSAARAIMEDVKNATREVRREMAKKYNVDF